MPLPLRPAAPSDLPVVAALMNIAYRGSGPNASWNTESPYIQGDRTSAAALQAELDANPASVLLLLEQDPGAPIQGCVFLEPVGQDTWYLGSLTVDPTLQKARLGRGLLEAAELWAAQHGALTLQIHVVHVRETLIAWYQRRGYRLTGATQPFPYGDTQFGLPLRDDLTFVVLEKSLAP